MSAIKIKRRNPFSLSLQIDDGDPPLPLNLTGHTIISQVRTPLGDLVETLIVTYADQGTNPGSATVSSASTANWPTGCLLWDFVVIYPDGHKIPSDTYEFEVEKEITSAN